jgi:taurine--2-oxoglutarate transaminase
MVTDRVAAECMKNGTYLMSWLNCLIVAPPLIVTPEEIDKGVDALDKALVTSDKEVT